MMDGSLMNLEKTSEETEAVMLTPESTGYPGWEFLLLMMGVAVEDAKIHHPKMSLVSQEPGALQRYP